MEKQLTKSEIETLAHYLVAFKRAYLLGTGKKLETVDQLLECAKSGEFTLEDMFYVYTDEQIERGSKDSITWDDHQEKFGYENFFPGDKSVSGGRWIKIKTENGFEVHFAKTSIRKRRFREEIEAKYKKIISFTKSVLKTLVEIDGVEDLNKAKTSREIKSEKLQLEIDILNVYEAIDVKPYEVVIKRTKTKSEYYMPHQYEVVEDIDYLISAGIASTPGVSLRSRPQGDIEDKVFYLRSRGISESIARILAGLNQTYFIVNMETVLDTYNEQFSSRAKLVSA